MTENFINAGRNTNFKKKKKIKKEFLIGKISLNKRKDN